MEAPAFGTVVARRGRTVERTPAFAPIELPQMPARQGNPHHAVAVDIGAAHTKAGRGHIVDFAQEASRIEPNYGAGITKRDRAPDAAVGRIRHDCVKTDRQTLILPGIRELTGSHHRSGLPFTFGV